MLFVVLGVLLVLFAVCFVFCHVFYLGLYFPVLWGLGVRSPTRLGKTRSQGQREGINPLADSPALSSELRSSPQIGRPVGSRSNVLQDPVENLFSPVASPPNHLAAHVVDGRLIILRSIMNRE